VLVCILKYLNVLISVPVLMSEYIWVELGEFVRVELFLLGFVVDQSRGSASKVR